MTPIKKGSAGIAAQITIAIITVCGAIGSSLVASAAQSNSAISDIRTQVVQVTERENNHYEEVQKQLTIMNVTLSEISKKIK